MMQSNWLTYYAVIMQLTGYNLDTMIRDESNVKKACNLLLK